MAKTKKTKRAATSAAKLTSNATRVLEDGQPTVVVSSAQSVLVEVARGKTRQVFTPDELRLLYAELNLLLGLAKTGEKLAREFRESYRRHRGECEPQIAFERATGELEPDLPPNFRFEHKA